MAKFKYVAKNAQGKTVSAVLEAREKTVLDYGRVTMRILQQVKTAPLFPKPLFLKRKTIAKWWMPRFPI